jgi:surface protein
MDGFQNYDGLTTTANMFNGMSELNTVEGLTYLNTSNVTDMSNMFSGCSALTTIYCNNDWSGLSATSTNMFAGCTNLEGVIKYYTNLDTEHKDDITYASPITGYFTPEGEPYAVLENGTLTFRFDKNRTEDAYLIPWIHADQNINYPGWHDDNFTERSITKVIFDESFRLYKLESAEQMFSGMETLTSIEGLEYFNTASINCMEGMFGGCISLESLDLRTFNTSNVVNMSMMFSNCTSLKYVDLSSFDVTNVTNMWAMFEECDALESLDLSNFNTTSVTNISRMFENCNNLRSIDLSSFTTINVVDIFNMFRGCTILNRIYCNEDWTSIDHSDVYFDVEGMFYECENLPLATGNGFENCKPKEDGGYFIKREAYALVSDGNLTFYNNEYRPTGVDVYNVERDGEGSWKTANFSTVTFDESFKTYRLTSTANMFSGMTGLTTIYDMNNLNVMSVTDMSSMFEGCLSLTTIYCNNDWSEMDVISTDMFTGSGVSEGGNENVAYAKPENGGYFTAYNAPYATLSANGTLTFTYSTKPTDGVVHDVVRTGFYPTWRPEIQIQEPTNAPGRGLKKATTTSITKVVFDPSFAEYDGLKSTADMFYNMYDLTTIEGLEYLNTDNVTDMSEMFALCTSLTDLSFPKNFNTSEVTDMREMFTNCVSIQTLDLTEFNTTNVMDMRKMFYNCNNMTTIYCEDDWSTNENINFYYNSSYNMFKDCTSLVGGSGSSYLSWLSNTVEYANPTNGYFTALPSITLYNNSSNAETINVNNGRKVNVTLSGRTLYKDGSWNTLCLPFDVTIEGSVLVDATVKTLESASFADNTLTLNFSEGNLAVMEAGKPYIIKWEGANISTTNLVDPKFNNVTVVSANPTVVTTTDAGGTNWVDFRGIYEPWVINATNNEVLYLGGNNTLYYPKPSASGMTIGAFRAVFDLKNGLVAGDPNSASGIRAYNVNFGDEGNGITQVVSDESQVSDWYTIDGRRLLEEPTQKGIYIKGGRKVMIK